jgi:TPP-dependent pyruvate/acetoin dehydrogenase alpha subunit
MMAEIYGKATGCAHGKGGSMHLIDESVGFMGSTAIVAGTVPVGVGLAYGIKHRRSDRVSCVFMGDAVAEAGVFFESLNFAALKQLPVLFVCENNLYSVYSPLSVRQPSGRPIHTLAAAMGVTARHGDGNDVRAAYSIVAEAVRAIRAGQGPQFVEFSTYRWREHCGPLYDNDIGYRTPAEFEEWKAKDPIARLEKALLADGTLTSADIDAMQGKIDTEIAAAFDFAERSPFPEPVQAFTDVYSMAAAR